MVNLLIFGRFVAPIALHEALYTCRLICCFDNVTFGLRSYRIVHEDCRDHSMHLVLVKSLSDLVDIVVVNGKSRDEAFSLRNL